MARGNPLGTKTLQKGDVRVYVSFETWINNKTGMREQFMNVAYKNVKTGKRATAKDLEKAGIRKQKARVQLTTENADYVFNMVERAAKGEITPSRAIGAIGSKTLGMKTVDQVEQFRDSLKKMFKSTNPTDAELAEFTEFVDSLDTRQLESFYIQNSKDLKPGFKGYNSEWKSLGADDEYEILADPRSQQGVLQARSARTEYAKGRILKAARSFRV